MWVRLSSVGRRVTITLPEPGMYNGSHGWHGSRDRFILTHQNSGGRSHGEKKG